MAAWLQPKLLGYESGPASVEARYLFTHTGGKRNRSASLLAAEGLGGRPSSDVMTIRTEYPCQTLDGTSPNGSSRRTAGPSRPSSGRGTSRARTATTRSSP